MVQFMALSIPLQGPEESPPIDIKSVFFSFQFYRFSPVTTQRLLMDSYSPNSGMPCILRKAETEGRKPDDSKFDE